MDLKYLNTFRVIVEEGGFSKAAERLNYTQSTITFQVAQLEQELSTTLFEKIGRKMVLTQAGERLIPYVDDILSSVDRLRNFEEDLTQCQGDLSVGLSETQLCYRMPPVLQELHSQAPKARLFLRSMNCYDIRDALINGTLDIGVFYEDVSGFGSTLTVYPLAECPLALVASPRTAEQYPDFVTPDRELAVSFIINEKNCIFRQIFEQYLREKSILLAHTIELWSIPTIKNLVKSDLGVTFQPLFAVQKDLDNGTLVRIPTELDDRTITAVCAHHKNKWVSPLMKLFLDLCTAQSGSHLL